MLANAQALAAKLGAIDGLELLNDGSAFPIVALTTAADRAAPAAGPAAPASGRAAAGKGKGKGKGAAAEPAVRRSTS